MHVLDRRRAGVLCAVSSLPAESHEAFLDFLVAAGLCVWQVLPLNPPDGHGSPYRAVSLFAGDPRLLRLSKSIELREIPPAWLEDYATFRVASGLYGPVWTAWPGALKHHRSAALLRFRQTHEQLIQGIFAEQQRFFIAWQRLKTAANERGILILGDMPLYPAHASADVWAHQALFALTSDGEPLEVAGVPSDYFSAMGQHWGNPVYRWSEHVATGFQWWDERIAHQLDSFDVLRIDHFRGLETYWVISPEQKADQGRWRSAPGRELLASLDPAQRNHLVAEDLGETTEEVEALRDDYGLPGMRVLQFGFDGDAANPHLPGACPEHAVIYTGTHDNNTSRGWYESLDSDTRRLVQQTVGDEAWPWPLIDAAFRSASNTAIVPLQDYLGLDGRHRMNTPGTAEGNWRWQVDPAALDMTLARRIRSRLEQSGRLQQDVG